VKSRVEYAAALLLELVGAGGALLVASQHWQTVRVPRPSPFSEDVLRVSGRTIDAAPTAFALVALAGVVAVLATHGLPRRVVGALVALAGAGVIWRAALAAPAISASRARALVRAKQPRVSMASSTHVLVSTAPIWAGLAVASGLLVLLAGALVALRGGRWSGMSSRYEAPDPVRDDARARASMWAALERGEDPTSTDDAPPSGGPR
jgi:uncharacterized membrane protein (TIGR02234 family)